MRRIGPIQDREDISELAQLVCVWSLFDFEISDLKSEISNSTKFRSAGFGLF
jgi:hypothetical protein